MITAPSITIPKSMAPSDIRFADTPKRCIIIKANKRDRGMTEATINPDLKFPRKDRLKEKDGGWEFEVKGTGFKGVLRVEVEPL